MNSVEAALSSWRKLILSNEFELPYEQLKSDIANKKWTSEEEPHIATYCLVAVNMKAYESLKSDFQDNHYIQKMFKLSELCCSIVEKTWKCKGANFLGSIYNICRYFLSQNHIYEALVVSQYAMEYVEKRNMDSLIEEELRSIKALLCLHLKYLSCTELTVGNSEVMLDVWKFVLSSQGINVKDSCADRILDSFQCFCNKAGSLVEHHKSSLVLVMYLKDIYFTNFNDSSFSYFITICRILINHSSSGETKKIILTIIECIDNFRASKTTVQNLFCKFCCQILRFSVCYVDSTETNLVDECVQQLQSISSLPPLLLNHAVYFASVILMHSRNCWFNEDSFFYKNCIISVFKLLLTLANEMKMVNMNQLSGTKNGSGRDHFFPICLANLVLSITYRISDWDTMTLKDSFPYVKQAAQISSTIYDENCEIDDKRKLQLYYLIAGSCVNVCRIYIKAELYEESRQISMIAAQKIAILSSSQLSDSSLQSCVEKLILCLFNSFKYLNLYEDALRTACNWAFKLPNAEKVFMELFASLKAKIFSSETKDYLNITSWDLLIKDKQRNQSIWSNINFKNLKILPLLKAELRQYAAHSVKSAPLIQKIINIVSEKEDIIMKIEFYVWSGIVLTLSNDCLKAATKLLPPIDSFIQEIEKKNKLKNTEEQSILYSYSLGNLYYTKFRINLLNARCGSEQEVILTDKIRAPRSILELGMEQEPEDVTDIINNYLTYESQQNIMSLLDSAINHWNDVVIKLKNVKSGEKYFDLTNEGSSLIIFLREAAFLYRLYCHESKEANAWKLLHSLAMICDNNEVATFAFSNLLSTSDDCDLKWKTEAESKLASLTPSIRIRYRLETANKLLKSGNASEGVALLSGINENDMKNDAILCAKYYFIVSQYECAGFLVPKHYAANTAFRAYCKLVSWIKNGCWGTFWESCEAQSLLFDVALFIGNSYRESYLINDAKSYLQEQVYLIQKLCLPLRISQFLIALCQVSYITCNVEDFYGKLTALKSVLKYGDKNQKNNRIVESCSKASLAVSPILSMNSDVRFVSTNASDDILSSPVFESGLKFDTPDFVYHESTCICAVCEDTRYQLILCEVMCLFGPYFYRAGKCGKALHHFKTALEMLDILQNRLKPIHSSKNMDILRLKIVTKIRHSDFWAWCRDFEKAKVFHREATVDNSHLIVPDQAIVRELKDQYWALNAIEVDILVKEEVIPKKKATRLKATLPTVIQTPASKKSVAIYEDDDEDSKAAELIKKMTITPHPKRSRRLLFKKDEPSFVTPIKPPPSSSRNTRLNKKPEHTPPDFVMQTPSSARRTTRTAKKDVGEIASVVTSTKLRSRKK